MFPIHSLWKRRYIRYVTYLNRINWSSHEPWTLTEKNFPFDEGRQSLLAYFKRPPIRSRIPVRGYTSWSRLFSISLFLFATSNLSKGFEIRIIGLKYCRFNMLKSNRLALFSICCLEMKSVKVITSITNMSTELNFFIVTFFKSQDYTFDTVFLALVNESSSSEPVEVPKIEQPWKNFIIGACIMKRRLERTWTATDYSQIIILSTIITQNIQLKNH